MPALLKVHDSRCRCARAVAYLTSDAHLHAAWKGEGSQLCAGSCCWWLLPLLPLLACRAMQKPDKHVGAGSQPITAPLLCCAERSAAELVALSPLEELRERAAEVEFGQLSRAN